MRSIHWLSLAAGILALTACDRDAVVMTGPAVDELWLGPEVIATGPELASLADVAADPVMTEVSALAPRTDEEDLAIALEMFSTGLTNDPGPSFVLLDHKLTSVYGDPELKLEPDAEMAGEVLDLYRDFASQTLFGMDRDALGPLTEPNGS